MVASGEDGLPAPAAEVVDTVRSRAERLEHVLQHFVPLPEGADQKLLRHRHRMRLLGRCEAARGLSEEHRAELGKPSQTDGPLFELNVLRVDGWTRTTTADGTHPKTHAKRSPSPASPSGSTTRAQSSWTTSTCITLI